VYRPEFYPDRAPDPNVNRFRDPEPVFLTWRTEEKPARSVAFREAMPEVIAAWKRARARELAKTRAETIAKELQKAGTTSEFQIRQRLNQTQAELQGDLKPADAKALEKVRRFALPDVAPLAPADRMNVAAMTAPESLRPFGLAPSQDIPYPTREMVKALLEERTKPVGTAVVLPDAP